MPRTNLPSILCVDTDPQLLKTFQTLLGREFDVRTIARGDEALFVLGGDDPPEVIVTDTHLPDLTGDAFLRKVREIAPDTPRIVLTGDADLDLLTAVVNVGAVFRLLRKPCSVGTLVAALRDGVQRYRLTRAERDLVSTTLSTTLKALTDVLALSNPGVYARSLRAKQYVGDLAGRFGISDRWPIETAAMLSQVGYVSLPPVTLERIYNGEDLDDTEIDAVERLPWTIRQLFGSIPRLEPVVSILIYQSKHFDGTGTPADGVRGTNIPWGARALKIVLDYDLLENTGYESVLATDTLRGRSGWYDPEILEAFAALRGHPVPRYLVREISVREVRPGMIIGSDVRNRNGAVLVAHGQTVTDTLLQRIRKLLDHTTIVEPILAIEPIVGVGG